VGYWQFGDHEGKSKVFNNLRVAYDAAIYSAEAFQDHVGKLKAKGTLSEKGIKEAAVKYVTETGLRSIVRNKLDATAALRRDVAARVGKMAPVTIDKTDLFAELQRREVRDALRAMPEDKRISIIERGEDQVVIDALLSAPDMLIPLPKSVREMATSRRLDDLYGDERKVMRDALEAAELVERAFDAAKVELQVGSGMSLLEFQTAARPIEQAIIDEFKSKFEKLPVAERPIDNIAGLVQAVKGVPTGEAAFADLGELLAGARAA
jgi:hypothetical protein